MTEKLNEEEKQTLSIVVDILTQILTATSSTVIPNKENEYIFLKHVNNKKSMPLLGLSYEELKKRKNGLSAIEKIFVNDSPINFDDFIKSDFDFANVLSTIGIHVIGICIYAIVNKDKNFILNKNYIKTIDVMATELLPLAKIKTTDIPIDVAIIGEFTLCAYSFLYALKAKNYDFMKAISYRCYKAIQRLSPSIQ